MGRETQEGYRFCAANYMALCVDHNFDMRYGIRVRE